MEQDKGTFTVFYAWQSDTAARDNRNFIESALEKALKQIAKTGTIDASPRLDRDTKDVPGIPDIANTILAKIRTASAFVADLTFIGTANCAADATGKPTPNPNVMLELGYALAELGWERIVCVLNKHYGSEQDLPFDLRNRRWPISYDLPPDADPTTRSQQKVALSEALCKAVETIAKLLPRKRQRSLQERVDVLERALTAVGANASQLARIEDTLSKITVPHVEPAGSEEKLKEEVTALRAALMQRVRRNEFEEIRFVQGMLALAMMPGTRPETPLPLHDREDLLRTRLPPFYASGWNHRRYGDRFVTRSNWDGQIDAVCEITDAGTLNSRRAPSDLGGATVF